MPRGLYSTNWDYYSQLEARQDFIRAALAGQTLMQGDDHRRRIYLGVVILSSALMKTRAAISVGRSQ